MKKNVLILIAVTVGLIAGYNLLKYYYHLDEQALLTAIKPPAGDIVEKLPQGSDLDTPLKIPAGMRLAVFADLKDVGNPRVLTFDSNGVLYVSLPREGKIIALPDKDRNGTADEIITVISDLNRPHGISFHSEKMYIAETDKVVRYDYSPDSISVSNGEVLFALPEGGRHFTRTIKILDGKLYTSVGSSCDVCVEKDEQRSAILISDLNGEGLRVYASGLRNTVFFAFDDKGRLWGNDMGRDFLGDLLPPDELNLISEGKDYGWPYCFGKNIRDLKFQPSQNLNYCASTEPTTFDYPAHIAPLGITFINSKLFAEADQGNLLSVFHGSWNSTVPVGYKIVKLTVEDNKVTKMEDFIGGWLKDSGDVLGRPVDLVFDPSASSGQAGVLYISDDKAGLIYILTKES